MNEIILATNNNGKKEEFKNILSNYSFLTLKEIGFKEEIKEDGNSFIENAIIKCRAVYNKIKKPVMADDSGLTVKALNGKPGIYSARYGGEGLTDKERYEHLLKQLNPDDKKNASFVCALALFINENRIYIVQEEICGEITLNPRGNNGFGYDPVFFLPDLNKTMAELTEDEKNKISHRGKAAEKLKQIIENL